MGSRPKVSIIIPAYNHELFISEAIQSVLAQTLQDFELIIIDDGSSDATFSRIEEFRDPRIRVFRQENQGAARTINRGMSLAQGEHLAILNSDDLYAPQRLETVSSYFDEHPETLLASSLIQPIDQAGNDILPSSEQPSWLKWYNNAIEALKASASPWRSLLQYNFVVSTSNIVIRSKYFSSLSPFNELLAYCHDYEFLLRALHDSSFHFFEELLLKYRLHPGNAIREEEFLTQLEEIYALVSTQDFETLFSDLRVERRKSHAIFKALSGNPDINTRYRIAELEDTNQRMNAQLKQADTWLEEFNEQMESLHQYAAAVQKDLAEAHAALYQTETRLSESDAKLTESEARTNDVCARLDQAFEEIHRLSSVIAVQSREIETRDRFLQEIYSSRSWKLVMRLRTLKQYVQRICARFENKLTPHHEWRATDENTYHAKMLYPLLRKRPKVIHVIANFLVGGSSRLVVDLIEHLGHKYDQEVISDLIPSPLAYCGFPLHQFSGSPKTSDLISFLKDKKAKIVHVHYWGDKDTSWYRAFFDAAGQVPGKFIENVNTLVPTYLSERIDRYVYVSECARCLHPHDHEKSVIIYPGSNLEIFQRDSSPVPDDTIGMVYRLEPDKLSEDSISPFIHVVKKRPQTKALIVGGGSLLEPYQSRVRAEGVEDRFEFTGYVPYEALPAFYRRMSVFIAPVWNESFGQVSPFAMGMRIPVAGYNIGALPEILGSTECLAATAEELAAIVVNLLDHREHRLAIGLKNFERVNQLFSIEAMVKNYDELYSDLLSS